LRRATDNVHVLVGEDGATRLEGGELRQFLMALDEFQQLYSRLERRLADTRIVEILANPQIAMDSKADFADESKMQVLADALKPLGLKVRLEPDEQHSTLNVVYHDDSHGDRIIGIEFAQHPEFKRFRAFARQTEKLNRPPFVVVKDVRRETITNWRDLIAHLKNEGTRDCSIQRYKGLGEMNPDQLWDTTMNAESRTLLEVKLEDAVEAEEIFTTLMGEDVEARRKFIETNALDVRNLDV
jgi:DNA gyrase subunit B